MLTFSTRDSIIACVPKINHQIQFRTLIKQQDKRQLRKQSTKLAKELKNKGVAMMTEKDTMQVKPEKKEDRRVRRTKKLLTHGLIQLMKEKQVQDITVRELADLVDVNRGTFYLYYRDIFDMLDSIEQELFNQVNQLIAAHKGETVLTHTLPVLKELFHLVEENKELCQVLLGQNGDMKFLKKLSDVVQEAFRREWLMMKKDEVTFDYSYAFGALGFVGLLRTWLERDCVEKADDMAVLSDRMIRLGLTSSLQTP